MKNTFWLFFGQLAGRLIRTALIIYAARVLGPTSWGAFSYVMSLSAFFLIFSDIGISAIVTRESAKNPDTSMHYFSTAFFIKSILLAVGALILVFGNNFITNIPEAEQLLPFIALLLIFDSFRNFGFAINRAAEKMEWEAINEIITNIAITGLGFYFLSHNPTSFDLTFSYITGTAIGCVLISFWLRHYFKNLFTHFNFKLIPIILRSSLPFALASFLGAIMLNTDLIMLGWMRTPEEIGFYSAAQKPIQFLYVFASLFATSLFPTLSRLTKDNAQKFRELLEDAVSFSLLAALPLAAVGIILGKAIIITLFGVTYMPAIIAFQILLPTLIIIFPSVLVSNSILAYGEQKRFVQFSLLGAIGNILFNFLLIPWLGIAGCTLSTLITQIIANRFIWKEMDRINSFSIFPKIKKISIATLGTALLTIVLQYADANLFLSLALALGCYIALLAWQKEPLLRKLA